ncbi:hypothetical protein, partial [Nodularia sphaerocarpa]|uniref:hypothetical protein n=1 Tax=Nodularia sphaerocarpa TaxID=137816 RepID=UPI00232B952B
MPANKRLGRGGKTQQNFFCYISPDIGKRNCEGDLYIYDTEILCDRIELHACKAVHNIVTLFKTFSFLLG